MWSCRIIDLVQQTPGESRPRVLKKGEEEEEEEEEEEVPRCCVGRLS
jgi:hypothetical protein